MPLPKRHVLSLLGTAAVAAMVVGVYHFSEPSVPPPLVLSDAPAPVQETDGKEADHRAPVLADEVTPERASAPVDNRPPVVRFSTDRWNLKVTSIDANFDFGLGHTHEAQSETAGSENTAAGSGGARPRSGGFFGGGGGSGGGDFGVGGGGLVSPPETNRPNDVPPVVLVTTADNQNDTPPAVVTPDLFIPNVITPGPGDENLGPITFNRDDETPVIPFVDTPTDKGIIGTLPVDHTEQGVSDPGPTQTWQNVPEVTSTLGLLAALFPLLAGLRRRLTARGETR